MSEKAKTAAITKAQRQLLQEQANKKLIESTQGQSALLIIKDLGTYQVFQAHGALEVAGKSSLLMPAMLLTPPSMEPRSSGQEKIRISHQRADRAA